MSSSSEINGRYDAPSPTFTLTLSAERGGNHSHFIVFGLSQTFLSDFKALRVKDIRLSCSFLSIVDVRLCERESFVELH